MGERELHGRWEHRTRSQFVKARATEEFDTEMFVIALEGLGEAASGEVMSRSRTGENKRTDLIES